MDGAQSTWMRTRSSLLRRVKEDPRPEVWDEFYRMYWRAIHGYSLRLGLSSEDAEDVVQEVFIKIFRRLPGFEYDPQRGRFLSWVHTITRTTVVDWHRRRQAREAVGDDPAAVSAGEPVWPDPWREEWERSLLMRALDQVRDQVQPETYQAFVLTALEGRPAAEAAEELGIARNAVYVYRHRVQARLKALIEEWTDDRPE